MNPDFIISEKHTANGSIYIVLPTHITAQNWLFARVDASERRSLSAHLVHARYVQLQSDAALANLTFKHPFSAGEQVH
jgi:hypothetical protein